MLLVAAGAIVAGTSLVSARDEIQAPPQSEVVSATSVSDGERFEGYLFLDVDGRPLPFQSDEAIEEFLRTAEVISNEKIPVGVTAPRKVLLEANGLRVNAVFKTIDTEQRNVRNKGEFYLVWRDDWYGFDIAAYHVDRLLGLNRVPPVVERRIKRYEGSVQIWLEQTITEKARRDDGLEPPGIARWNQQKATMHVFNNLVANRDSNLGNSLIDQNWRRWFIDCSRCFEPTDKLLSPKAITHCDRSLWHALQELDPETARDRLEPYLTKPEIDAMMKRHHKLVELIQGLIDQSGEELVIFDFSPPTKTAHWGRD
ncbi:MAG: hypothetical protein KAJ97_02350 [Acidobacteria bacterium]|nr:hypothetical protein [Acidobacteriota bacterium]